MSARQAEFHENTWVSDQGKEGIRWVLIYISVIGEANERTKLIGVRRKEEGGPGWSPEGPQEWIAMRAQCYQPCSEPAGRCCRTYLNATNTIGDHVLHAIEKYRKAEQRQKERDQNVQIKLEWDRSFSNPFQTVLMITYVKLYLVFSEFPSTHVNFNWLHKQHTIFSK